MHRMSYHQKHKNEKTCQVADACKRSPSDLMHDIIDMLRVQFFCSIPFIIKCLTSKSNVDCCIPCNRTLYKAIIIMFVTFFCIDIYQLLQKLFIKIVSKSCLWIDIKNCMHNMFFFSKSSKGVNKKYQINIFSFSIFLTLCKIRQNENAKNQKIKLLTKNCSTHAQLLKTIVTE